MSELAAALRTVGGVTLRACEVGAASYSHDKWRPFWVSFRPLGCTDGPFRAVPATRMRRCTGKRRICDQSRRNARSSATQRRIVSTDSAHCGLSPPALAGAVSARHLQGARSARSAASARYAARPGRPGRTVQLAQIAQISQPVGPAEAPNAPCPSSWSTRSAMPRLPERIRPRSGPITACGPDLLSLRRAPRFRRGPSGCRTGRRPGCGCLPRRRARAGAW
jgi:hypothetical protein